MGKLIDFMPILAESRDVWSRIRWNFKTSELFERDLDQLFDIYNDDSPQEELSDTLDKLSDAFRSSSIIAENEQFPTLVLKNGIKSESHVKRPKRWKLKNSKQKKGEMLSAKSRSGKKVPKFFDANMQEETKLVKSKFAAKMIEENFDEDELTPDTHPPELIKQKTDDQLMSKSMKEKRKESLSSPNEFNIQR